MPLYFGYVEKADGCIDFCGTKASEVSIGGDSVCYRLCSRSSV